MSSLSPSLLGLLGDLKSLLHQLWLTVWVQDRATSRSVPFSALLYFMQLATSQVRIENYLLGLVVIQS